MKTKNFKDYLKNRLHKKEIQEIEESAMLEVEAIRTLQKDISKSIDKYMSEENIGFNELVRRLGISASQASKMQKGQANLTLLSIAHLSALIKKRPRIKFE
jgi:DNA-binding Xre family transcriptional regulator